MLVLAAYAQPADEPLPRFWVPDGPVQAILVQGNTVYIGGQFDYLGPKTGGGAILSAATGTAKRGFPEVVGTIYAGAPDGLGGWYLGGAFSSVGGVPRKNLAHVNSDNTIDPKWDPSPNNTVQVILVQGNTVYLGGSFTKVGDQARSRAAAVNAVTGAPLAWNPSPSGTVSALAYGDGLIYLGGSFTAVATQSRTRLASVDATTAQLTAWNPGATPGTVNVLAVSGTTVYAGGTFTTAGAKPRNRLASFSTSSDFALDWNPNASAAVETLAVVGNTVYVGGQFTSIGSATRNRLAALDVETFVATGWNPNVNGTVNTLAVAGNKVFIGGTFSSVGNESRNKVAGIDAATGAVLPWDPLLSALGDATAPQTTFMAVQDDEVLFGSTFSSIGGVLRANVAALDLTSGEAAPWNPGADGAVRTLAAAGDAIFAGGTYTNIGGVERRRLAALNPATGVPTGWNPNVLGRAAVGVFSVLPAGNRLFVGGNFTNIAGFSRLSIAAFDLGTGEIIQAWNPGAQAASASTSASVNALAIGGDALYVGGDFVTFGGQSRARLAAVSATSPTAALIDWNPGAQAAVLTLAVSGANLYVGGAFTTLGGLTRGRIGAFDLATGTVTAWNPDAGSTTGIQMRALHVAGQSVYSGGAFTKVGGEFRNRLAGVRINSGLAHSWNPDLDAGVSVLYATPDILFVGGDFTKVGGAAQAYFAAFSLAPAFDQGTAVMSNGTFTATLRLGEGARVITQASSDLVNWTSLSTNVPSGVKMQFADTPSAEVTSRYYRAVTEQ